MDAKLTPFLIREFLRGLVDRSTLPPLLVRQLEAIQRRVIRQGTRYAKRENKAREYRGVALAGGGKRELARRSGELYRQSTDSQRDRI